MRTKKIYIVEKEAILALLKVHLCTKNGKLSFLVDEDGRPVLIHHFVLGLFGIGIVQSVTQTCPKVLINYSILIRQ